MKKITILLLCIVANLNLYSQASELGSWYSYLGTYDIAKRWDVQANTQFRFHNILGDWDQYLLRIGANYKLDPKGNHSVGLGFDYFYNEPYIANTDVKTRFDEFRIYEQYISKQSYKRFYLQHRYRLENRFRQNRNVFFRFRYFLQVKMALNKKRIVPGTFYLALLNETFWSIQGPSHFDRYWLHYTVGYKLNNKWTFEVGNQTQFTGNGNYNSRLQFWAFHKLNFLKRKQQERPKQ